MFSNKDTVLESVEFSTAAVGCDISAFGRANYDKAFYDIRKKDGIFIRNTYDAEGLRAELEENGKLVRFLSSIREKSAESGTLERMCSADSPEAAVGSGNNAAEPLYEQLMRDRGIPSTLTPEEKALNRALDLRMQYEGGSGSRIVNQPKNVERQAKKLSPEARAGYERAIEALESGDTRGLNDHPLSANRSGQRAIDIRGTGRGRGAGRIIYEFGENDIINIIEIITDHKY